MSCWIITNSTSYSLDRGLFDCRFDTSRTYVKHSKLSYSDFGTFTIRWTPLHIRKPPVSDRFMVTWRAQNRRNASYFSDEWVRSSTDRSSLWIIFCKEKKRDDDQEWIKDRRRSLQVPRRNKRPSLSTWAGWDVTAPHLSLDSEKKK